MKPAMAGEADAITSRSMQSADRDARPPQPAGGAPNANGGKGVRRYKRRIGRILCMVPAAWFFAGVIFALFHFGDYGSRLPQFLRYVAGPAALGAAFLFAGYRLRPGLAIRIGSLATAALIALFAFEVVMTLGVLSTMLDLVGETSQKRPAATWEAEGLPTGRTVRALNKKLGVTRLNDAVLGGIPYRRVQLCSDEGKPVYYQADRYGFNNADTAFDAPIDTMVLGDSFVEGICLPREKAIVGQLQQYRPGSVSIATRGAGPLLELAFLGRYGPVLHPRTIVIAYFEGNDWENLRSESGRPWLRQALTPGADFGLPGVPAETAARAQPVLREWSQDSFELLRVLETTAVFRNFMALNHSATALGIYYPKVSPAQPIYEEVLQRSKAIGDSLGAHILLVYIPSIDRFTGLFPRDFVWNQQRDQVFAAAAATGIDTLDLATSMRAQPKPRDLYADDSHFNAAGAAFAARAIADRLDRRATP